MAMGCGSSDLDGARLSDSIEESLKRQKKAVRIEVKCPPQIERQAGAKTTCPYVSDQETGVIRVVQQDDEGSVRWQADPKSVRRF